MRAHFTRDVSSDVPVKYDTKRYDIASYSISRLELSDAAKAYQNIGNLILLKMWN